LNQNKPDANDTMTALSGLMLTPLHLKAGSRVASALLFGKSCRKECFACECPVSWSRHLGRWILKLPGSGAATVLPPPQVNPYRRIRLWRDFVAFSSKRKRRKDNFTETGNNLKSLIAALAMAFSSVSVVSNSLRLRKWRP
jgi:hypothetical protein